VTAEPVTEISIGLHADRVATMVSAGRLVIHRELGLVRERGP
jgi:hypothetical protein